MLSDLEADVLLAIEGRPEFAGAWRLPPRGGESPRISVALIGRRGAGRLVGIPDGRFIHWFPAGTPGNPPPGSVAIALGAEDRARARRRAEERLGRSTEPVSDRAAPATPELPLSDLEADVLLASEEPKAQIFGVWRLPPEGPDGARVAVALRGFRAASAIARLPDARFVRCIEHGADAPKPEWIALRLGDADRERARLRAAEREARAAPESGPPDLPFEPLSTFGTNPDPPAPKASAPTTPRSERVLPPMPATPPLPPLFERGENAWSAPLEPPNRLYEERTSPPPPSTRPPSGRRPVWPIVDPHPHEDGSTLVDPPPVLSQDGTTVPARAAPDPPAPPPVAVLLVSRSSAFEARLRDLASDAVTITRVATGWEALELHERSFDRVVWLSEGFTLDEPSEARFLRALAATRPTLARNTFFVVDASRRDRIASENPKIASRFVGDSDPELRRIML